MKKRYVPHGRTRQHKIEVRLNDEEYFKLIDTISLMKTNKSEYLRKLIVGTRIKEKPPDEFYKYMKEFSLMGSNLNQIAEKINIITKNEDWEYEDIEAKDFIKQLKRLRINLLNLKKRLENEYL
mgnify:CR=1 FL=1|jgi:hypothetical protein